MLNFFKKLFTGNKSNKAKNPAKFFSETEATVLKNADEHIVVGKILEITAHPDPKVTKVRVTQTEIAPNVVKQILCGGTNIEAGKYVPVATIGTRFPDFEIGERKIRGVLSQGMICSRTELGLKRGDEPDHGIWLLDDKFATKLGEKICELAK